MIFLFVKSGLQISLSVPLIAFQFKKIDWLNCSQSLCNLKSEQSQHG